MLSLRLPAFQKTIEGYQLSERICFLLHGLLRGLLRGLLHGPLLDLLLSMFSPGALHYIQSESCPSPRLYS